MVSGEGQKSMLTIEGALERDAHFVINIIEPRLERMEDDIRICKS